MSLSVVCQELPSLLGLGAFRNTQKDHNASFSDTDIQGIMRQVQHGVANDKELAIDILVNLAAGKDDASRGAQLALRTLYADPYGTDESDPPVGQHVKDEIRQDISKAAHRMCELALTDGFQPKDNKGRALSVTVAYLGAQHTQCTPDFKKDINQYVHGQMFGLSENESNENWLAPQRTVSQAELLAVGNSSYGDRLGISESAVNLALDVATSDASAAAQVESDFKKSMTALKTDLGVGECRATWVHTGSKDYPHWMPMVVRRTEEKKFEFVLLNTDKRNENGRANQVVDKFITLVKNASGDDLANWKGTFCQCDTQSRAGSGCAPLGHEFLKSVGQALKAGSSASPADIAKQCTERWGQMSDHDLTAMVQGNRAELVSARAHLGESMAVPVHARQPKPAAMPAGPALKSTEELNLEKDITNLHQQIDLYRQLPHGFPKGLPDPVPMPLEAQLPPGEQPLSQPVTIQSSELLGAKAPIKTAREKLDRLIGSMGLAIENGRTSDGKPAPYTSAFVGLTKSMQAAMPKQVVKVAVSKFSVSPEIARDKQYAQKFLAGLDSSMNDPGTVAQLSKLSSSMKPLFGALMVAAQAWMQNTQIHAIGNPELQSRLPNVSQLGVLALAAQFPSRMAMPLEVAMNVAMANDSPSPKELKSIENAMEEVVSFIDSRKDALNMAIADLEDIIYSPSPGDSPALKSEASNLLDALKLVQKEFQKSDGAIQSTRQFAEVARDYPAEALAVMRTQLSVKSDPVAVPLHQP